MSEREKLLRKELLEREQHIHVPCAWSQLIADGAWDQKAQWCSGFSYSPSHLPSNGVKIKTAAEFSKLLWDSASLLSWSTYKGLLPLLDPLLFTNQLTRSRSIFMRQDFSASILLLQVLVQSEICTSISVAGWSICSHGLFSRLWESWWKDVRWVTKVHL